MIEGFAIVIPARKDEENCQQMIDFGDVIYCYHQACMGSDGDGFGTGRGYPHYLIGGNYIVFPPPLLFHLITFPTLLFVLFCFITNVDSHKRN